MAYEPVIAPVSLRGSRVTVYGNYHLEEQLAREEEQLRELMADHDVLAAEWAGYPQDDWLWDVNRSAYTTIADTATGLVAGAAPNGFEEYGEAIDALAHEYFDALWGPDTFRLLPTVTSVSVPLLVGAGLAGAGAVRGGRQLVEQYQNDAGVDVYEQVVDWVTDPDSVAVSRRDLLLLGGVGAAVWFGGGVDAVLTMADLEEVDDVTYPASFNYYDMREVVAAEGIDYIVRETGGDVLGVWGRTHAASIAGYLERPDLREWKLDGYSTLLGQSDVFSDDVLMPHWVEDGDQWRLDQVIDLGTGRVRRG